MQFARRGRRWHERMHFAEFCTKKPFSFFLNSHLQTISDHQGLGFLDQYPTREREPKKRWHEGMHFAGGALAIKTFPLNRYWSSESGSIFGPTSKLDQKNTWSDAHFHQCEQKTLFSGLLSLSHAVRITALSYFSETFLFNFPQLPPSKWGRE